MTTALLALDDSDESHLAAITATTLLGPDTTYLGVHVESGVGVPPSTWGPVYGYPYPAIPPTDLRDPALRRDAIERARLAAAEQVAAAGVDAVPIGEVGDPVQMILQVAHEHRADVIVVGAHDRGWFHRLVEGSVADELLKSADVPVLVVPPPDRS